MAISLEPVARLSRDIVKTIAKGDITKDQARFLVDAYYQMQDYRKANENQVRALTATSEAHEVLRWFGDQFSVLEDQVARALDHYSQTTNPGLWMRSVKGIGPVLASNFLAHLDVTRSETAGGFWRFAGLDPSSKWLPKTKRPFNASLKVACWKAGDSWVKLSGHADSFYSQIYVQRKKQEAEKNERGEFAEQAKVALAILKDTKTPTYALNVAGKLSPAHVDARARRYAVKLFLAHLHHVMYEDHHGRPPPLPYVLTHLGHAHIIAPPGWPLPDID